MIDMVSQTEDFSAHHNWSRIRIPVLARRHKMLGRLVSFSSRIFMTKNASHFSFLFSLNRLSNRRTLPRKGSGREPRTWLWRSLRRTTEPGTEIKFPPLEEVFVASDLVENSIGRIVWIVEVTTSSFQGLLKLVLPSHEGIVEQRFSLFAADARMLRTFTFFQEPDGALFCN